MSSSSEVLTFSRDVVDSLPDYYRCLAEHLADTGRANTSVRSRDIKTLLLIVICLYYHQLLLYCCRYHEACLTGRPRFYKGFPLSPCVRDGNEPDQIDYPTRRRWPYW